MVHRYCVIVCVCRWPYQRVGQNLCHGLDLLAGLIGVTPTNEPLPISFSTPMDSESTGKKIFACLVNWQKKQQLEEI